MLGLRARGIKLLLLVVLLLLLLVGGGVALAIGNPTVTSVEEAKVFRNVLVAGDQLFFVRYIVNYASTPSEPSSDTFLVAIYDGTTLKYTRPLNYYQHNIISVYLTPSQALTWQYEYTVKVMGNPALFGSLIEGTNMASRVLDAGAYEEQAGFGAFLIAQARILQASWGITLLTADDLLNATGATYFKKAIPGLDSMVSGIFSVGSGAIIVPKVNWTHAYESNLTGQAGPNLTYALTGIGSIFGMSALGSTLWFVGMAYLVLAGMVYAGTKNSMIAILLPLSVVVGFAWVGVGGTELVGGRLISPMFTIAGFIVIGLAVLFGIYFLLGRLS